MLSPKRPEKSEAELYCLLGRKKSAEQLFKAGVSVETTTATECGLLDLKKTVNNYETHIISEIRKNLKGWLLKTYNEKLVKINKEHNRELVDLNEKYRLKIIPDERINAFKAGKQALNDKGYTKPMYATSTRLPSESPTPHKVTPEYLNKIFPVMPPLVKLMSVVTPGSLSPLSKLIPLSSLSLMSGDSGAQQHQAWH